MQSKGGPRSENRSDQPSRTRLFFIENGEGVEWTEGREIEGWPVSSATATGRYITYAEGAEWGRNGDLTRNQN